MTAKHSKPLATHELEIVVDSLPVCVLQGLEQKELGLFLFIS